MQKITEVDDTDFYPFRHIYIGSGKEDEKKSFHYNIQFQMKADDGR